MFGNTVYLEEESNDLRLRRGRFPSTKLKLISEKFQTAQPMKVKPFVFRPITIRKRVGDVALESEGVELQRGSF